MSRTSEGTLYHQILAALSQRIESGEIRVGDRLPSETDLERDYGVSRTTARRALDELRRQGIVRREPGRGTFLVAPSLRLDLTCLYSFTEELERLGHQPGARLISKEEIGASREVASKLGIEPGEKTLQVCRLRMADEDPIFVTDSYLAVERFPSLRDADYTVNSLNDLFQEKCGSRIERAQQWMGAIIAPEDVASLLELEPGAPVLEVRRVHFLSGDLPIEAVTAFFHPRRYQYYSELVRKDEA